MIKTVSVISVAVFMVGICQSIGESNFTAALFATTSVVLSVLVFLIQCDLERTYEQMGFSKQRGD